MSDENDALIVLMWQSGRKLKDIAKAVGLSTGRISIRARNLGLPIRRAGRPTIGPSDIPDLVKRYASGETVEQIAKSLNRKSRTIARLLKQSGVKIKNKGYPTNRRKP